MKRFIAYRRNISQRDTHNALQKNADDEVQFEGVIFTDGSVALRWRTACRSTSVWNTLADMLAIHGHPEYGTEIHWIDEAQPPQEWLDQIAAAELIAANGPGDSMSKCATSGDCYKRGQKLLRLQKTLERLQDILEDQAYEPYERCDAALFVIREVRAGSATGGMT